ncbi:hypothetical protein HDV06_005728 [Boothiomyces sp. JEL0866]|nr:hypothetical protein HDV06_005728 [Boothiomyces sp. JEL0866]
MKLHGYICNRHWNPFAGMRWTPITLPYGKQRPGNSLSLVTYNIWFDGLLQKERCNALIQEISIYDPDIICLQECTNGSQKVLAENPYIRQKYIMSDFGTESFDTWYGVVMLTKRDLLVTSIEKIPFNSRMGRFLVKTTLSLHGKQITIGTSHFESGFSDSECRKLQWRESTSNLSELAILCGDFNIHDDEMETEFLSNLGWKDSWHGAKKQAKDLERNGVTFGIWKGGRRRLDRVLYRGSLKPISIQTIGDVALEGYPTTVYISDHFGVYAKFDIE